MLQVTPPPRGRNHDRGAAADAAALAHAGPAPPLLLAPRKRAGSRVRPAELPVMGDLSAILLELAADDSPPSRGREAPVPPPPQEPPPPPPPPQPQPPPQQQQQQEQLQQLSASFLPLPPLHFRTRPAGNSPPSGTAADAAGGTGATASAEAAAAVAATASTSEERQLQRHLFFSAPAFVTAVEAAGPATSISGSVSGSPRACVLGDLTRADDDSSHSASGPLALVPLGLEGGTAAPCAQQLQYQAQLQRRRRHSKEGDNNRNDTGSAEPDESYGGYGEESSARSAAARDALAAEGTGPVGLLQQLLPVAPGASVPRLLGTISALAIAFRQLEVAASHTASELAAVRDERDALARRAHALEGEAADAQEAAGFLRHGLERLWRQQLLQQQRVRQRQDPGAGADADAVAEDVAGAVEDEAAAGGAGDSSGAGGGGGGGGGDVAAGLFATCELPSLLHLLRGEALQVAAGRLGALEAEALASDLALAACRAQVRDVRAWQGAGLAAMRQELARLHADAARAGVLHAARVQQFESRAAAAGQAARLAEEAAAQAKAARIEAATQLQSASSELSLGRKQLAAQEQEQRSQAQRLAWAEEAVVVLKREVGARDALLARQGAAMLDLQREAEAARAGAGRVALARPGAREGGREHEREREWDGGLDMGFGLGTDEDAAVASPLQLLGLGAEGTGLEAEAAHEREAEGLRRALGEARAENERFRAEAAASAAAAAAAATAAAFSVADEDPRDVEIALLHAQLRAAVEYQRINGLDVPPLGRRRLDTDEGHNEEIEDDEAGVGGDSDWSWDDEGALRKRGGATGKPLRELDAADVRPVARRGARPVADEWATLRPNA